MDEPSSARAARKAESVSPSDPRGTSKSRQQGAKRLPPGIVPTLLRRRPVASGPHFGLHADAVADEASSIQGMLIVAAPKRVLKRAVERNAMRRVAREAWRAAGLHRMPVVALLRVRAAFAPSEPGAGLPARKRLARAELDRLFGATNAALSRRGIVR